MTQNVIINKINNKISVYVLENGKLVEMYCQSNEKESAMGNIYNGQVTDVINGMQAAFVDIGKERNAFISVKDAMKKVDTTKEELNTDIKMSNVLKTGQKILVQVKKDAVENKGARVSTHITLPGKYVIIMPNTDIITISQKIDDEEEIIRLKRIVKENLPDNFGAIIRTDAESIGENEIVNDINATIKKWNEIYEKSEKDFVGILYDDYDIVSRAIRDIINKSTQKVYTNDADIYSEVVEKIEENICILDEDADLCEKFDLKPEIDKIRNKRIYLNCGGYIVIDKTEALTAIDVNSGKYTGNIDLENTTLKVNTEAAIEIMRQMRLRDVGGIIIIDFIDMHNEEHKSVILDAMKKEARKDRSKVDIKDFTKLNLVEMTRKKLYV